MTTTQRCWHVRIWLAVLALAAMAVIAFQPTRTAPPATQAAEDYAP